MYFVYFVKQLNKYEIDIKLQHIKTTCKPAAKAKLFSNCQAIVTKLGLFSCFFLITVMYDRIYVLMAAAVQGFHNSIRIELMGSS